jgi:hypothetical protein
LADRKSETGQKNLRNRVRCLSPATLVTYDREIYTMSRILSPTMIAEYKTQLPDKKLLQQKLHDLIGDFTDHVIESKSKGTKPAEKD